MRGVQKTCAPLFSESESSKGRVLLLLFDESGPETRSATVLWASSVRLPHGRGLWTGPGAMELS